MTVDAALIAVTRRANRVCLERERELAQLARLMREPGGLGSGAGAVDRAGRDTTTRGRPRREGRPPDRKPRQPGTAPDTVPRMRLPGRRRGLVPRPGMLQPVPVGFLVEELESAQAARGVPVFAVRYPDPLPPYSPDVPVRVWRAGNLKPVFEGRLEAAAHFEARHDWPGGGGEAARNLVWRGCDIDTQFAETTSP